jgi:hypothetical protein
LVEEYAQHRVGLSCALLACHGGGTLPSTLPRFRLKRGGSEAVPLSGTAARTFRDR